MSNITLLSEYKSIIHNNTRNLNEYFENSKDNFSERKENEIKLNHNYKYENNKKNLLANDEFRIELTGSTQKMFPDKNNVWVVYYAVYNPPGNSVEIKFYIDSVLKKNKKS